MMFTLVVHPDGKAILTTRDDLSQRMAEAVRNAWETWRTSDEASALIIPGCEVVQVHDIQLDVPDEGGES